MFASTIDLEKCYQLLGICHKASLDDLKTAYRSLARQLHPDLNPGDVDAHQRFITLNQAYQVLLDRISSPPTQSSPIEPSVSVRVTRKSPPPSTTTSSPPLSKEDAELKYKSYTQVQLLLKQHQFLKAIGLIEGLAQRLPQDVQVCQWQGTIYAQFGYQLIDRKELHKARIYLKKALKSDPHNRQLWQEVNRAFDRIARSI
jgi:tetratricopeptide (TPR) repeat protein